MTQLISAWMVLMLLVMAGCVSAGAQATGGSTPNLRQVPVYFGTYTRGDSKGIYRSVLDLQTGQLTTPELVGESTNPSFVALHPSGRYLYAVGEAGTFNGRKTGFVSAFAIDPATGNLSLLNQQASEGSGPCHLAVHPGGRALVVANYSAGSTASLPIGEDGRLEPAISAHQHSGSGADPKRQAGPHAHNVRFDPTGTSVYVCDLGMDRIVAYRFDPTTGTMAPAPDHDAKLAPGAGPRHFTFHPTGCFAYVINELDNTITAFKHAGGKLQTLHSVPTLPADFTGKNTTAEVVVHPSGKFLYGSNRGHDSLAIYRIDESTGRLTFVAHQPTGGKTPRNFNIDPTGRILLAANMDSNNVVVFRIDAASGKLTQTAAPTALPIPVCVRFAEPAR